MYIRVRERWNQISTLLLTCSVPLGQNKCSINNWGYYYSKFCKSYKNTVYMNCDLTEPHKPEMSVSKETRVFFLWKRWSLIGVCLSWNKVSEKIVERVGQKQGAGRGKFRKQVWSSIMIRWEEMTGKQISLHFDHNLRILKKRLDGIKFFLCFQLRTKFLFRLKWAGVSEHKIYSIQR